MYLQKVTNNSLTTSDDKRCYINETESLLKAYLGMKKTKILNMSQCQLLLSKVLLLYRSSQDHFNDILNFDLAQRYEELLLKEQFQFIFVLGATFSKLF